VVVSSMSLSSRKDNFDERGQSRASSELKRLEARQRVNVTEGN